MYLIKEFQRLKDEESHRLSLAWNLNRTLSKLNYRIHTDAIKTHLIPPQVTPAQASTTYATEADVLNMALFGNTAKQWRAANAKLEGNMRDHATWCGTPTEARRLIEKHGYLRRMEELEDAENHPAQIKSTAPIARRWRHKPHIGKTPKNGNIGSIGKNRPVRHRT